jgi:hypothetical protein
VFLLTFIVLFGIVVIRNRRVLANAEKMEENQRDMLALYTRQTDALERIAAALERRD